MSDAPTPHRLRAWILTEPTQSEVIIWGLSTAERLRRALLASGLSPEQISVGTVLFNAPNRPGNSG
jgi:hypothetical protein